jgi:hypothetical protein
MLDKDLSGATGDPEIAPTTAGTAPGGACPQPPSPAEPTVDSSLPYRQFTLQYLIAALKKPSHKE